MTQAPSSPIPEAAASEGDDFQRAAQQGASRDALAAAAARVKAKAAELRAQKAGEAGIPSAGMARSLGFPPH